MDVPLKVYFLPFLAKGHLIPLLQFARLFATRGLHVTIITTPVNARFLEKSINTDVDVDVDVNDDDVPHIHIHTVKFPYEDVGLTHYGLENLSDTTDLETASKICMAVAMLRYQVEPFVHLHPPHCIVSDFVVSWTSDLATRLGIPRLVFNPFPLFATCMIDAVRTHFPESSQLISHGADHMGRFMVPGLPDPIFLALPPPRQYFGTLEALIEDQVNSYGLIVNSFGELDGEDYIHHYNKTTHGHKVWHIGPASLMLPHTNDGEHSRIRSWLNSKEVDSVVYISFGSMCRFPKKQLVEIACGVESSGHSFVWVLPREYDSSNCKQKSKESSNSSEEDDDDDDDDESDVIIRLLEEFEERMRKENRGMILRGWAPQTMILNHPAVGGFLMHCGWTSVTEGISAGVPMMTWPIFAEQFYNEKLITQVHGIGVEVGAEEWIRSPYDPMEKVVSRVKIENAVRRLMDGGDEFSRQVRRKAREMAEKARKAVEDGGSSHRNLTALIEDLKRLALDRATH